MAYAGRMTPIRDPMGRQRTTQPVQSAKSFKEGLRAMSGASAVKQEVARAISVDDIRKKAHAATNAQAKPQKRQRPIREADLELDF